VAEIDERILQRARQHGFQTALISTDGMLPFPDQSFDIVHCNSVIEHVLVPEHRARLASEIQRVGRNWFIQTPNRYFFFEPHTGLPFAQFLPEPLVRVLLRYMRRVWDGALGWRLLDKREILSLFPAGALIRERFLGLTKSLVVVGGDRIRRQADTRPVARRVFPLPAR
jgi:2-polyprenyl-3-methyl-5-hydroxy-6-metoxy-1,4-benzoquinol methylase